MSSKSKLKGIIDKYIESDDLESLIRNPNQGLSVRSAIVVFEDYIKLKSYAQLLNTINQIKEYQIYTDRKYMLISLIFKAPLRLSDKFMDYFDYINDDISYDALFYKRPKKMYKFLIAEVDAISRIHKLSNLLLTNVPSNTTKIEASEPEKPEETITISRQQLEEYVGNMFEKKVGKIKDKYNKKIVVIKKEQREFQKLTQNLYKELGNIATQITEVEKNNMLTQSMLKNNTHIIAGILTYNANLCNKAFKAILPLFNICKNDNMLTIEPKINDIISDVPTEEAHDESLKKIAQLTDDNKEEEVTSPQPVMLYNKSLNKKKGLSADEADTSSQTSELNDEKNKISSTIILSNNKLSHNKVNTPSKTIIPNSESNDEKMKTHSETTTLQDRHNNSPKTIILPDDESSEDTSGYSFTTKSPEAYSDCSLEPSDEENLSKYAKLARKRIKRKGYDQMYGLHHILGFEDHIYRSIYEPTSIYNKKTLLKQNKKYILINNINIDNISERKLNNEVIIMNEQCKYEYNKLPDKQRMKVFRLIYPLKWQDILDKYKRYKKYQSRSYDEEETYLGFANQTPLTRMDFFLYIEYKMGINVTKKRIQNIVNISAFYEPEDELDLTTYELSNKQIRMQILYKICQGLNLFDIYSNEDMEKYFEQYEILLGLAEGDIIPEFVSENPLMKRQIKYCKQYHTIISNSPIDVDPYDVVKRVTRRRA